MLILPLRFGDAGRFRNRDKIMIIDGNGEAAGAVVAENFLQHHFGLDRMIQVQCGLQNNRRVDIVESGASIRLDLSPFAADPIRSAGITLIVPPDIFPKQITRLWLRRQETITKKQQSETRSFDHNALRHVVENQFSGRGLIMSYLFRLQSLFPIRSPVQLPSQREKYSR